VTGAGIWVGSESARFYGDNSLSIIGIDNDMRSSTWASGVSSASNDRQSCEGVETRRDGYVPSLPVAFGTTVLTSADRAVRSSGLHRGDAALPLSDAKTLLTLC
jgi:hypothetical protein